MIEELTRAEYDTLLRQEFIRFVERCFYELNPQAELALNWHLDVIAAKLTAVREGKIRRLIINLPPRHLKSLMASIAFPAWCLGHDPSVQILCVSYAQDLADKLARDCRSIMMSPWYRRIFRTRFAEADEVHEIETIWGPRCLRRRQGEALHPEREPLDTLERIRRTIGEYNFAGQYQQSPAPLGGGLVKVEWFKRYRENERPERFDRIVQSWDTANKATELSDFSVCTTWGVRGKELYLLGLLRQRLEYPALKRAVREQENLYKANVVLIEDKASGTQLIQELIAEGCHAVTRYQPDCEKIMRLHAQTAMIENGFVYIPETAPWLAEYLHELTVFPKGKHDDQVDSTAQFLDWFKRPCPAQAWYEYYRRLAQEAEERRKPKPVQIVYAIGSMEWHAEQKKKKSG